MELFKAIKPETKRLDMRVLTKLNARLKGYHWRGPVQPSTQGIMEFFQPSTNEIRGERWLLDLFRRHCELDRVHLCETYGKRAECVGWFYGLPKSLFCSDNRK